MSKPEKIKVEGVPLTPELATRFANMTPVDGERPLKENRVRFLDRHVEKGTFLGVDWHQGTERAAGKVYRLNGQHSSHVLTHLDPDRFPKDLLATITTWEFDAADKPVIFNYFDNPRSVRNNIDMMATYRAEHDDLAHIDLDVLVHAADGVYVHNASVKEGVSYPPRDRGLYYMKPEYRQFAIWLETLTHDPKPDNPGKDSTNRWLLGQAGVAAEMYVDYVRSAALADEFWGYVVRESHPDNDHETRELAKQYNDWRASGGRTRTQDDFRRKAATYWKRYIAIRTTTAPSAT
jgi:hypothetical protein